MPDITQIQPLSVTPQAETNRRMELAQREADPSFSELSTAALLQGPVASAFNFVDRSPLMWEADPNFSLHPSDPFFKELTDGVDPAYWPQFADAVSQRHAYYIKDIALNRQKYREQLGAAGASGVAASTVASLMDPVYLAAGIASGGLGMATGATKTAQLINSGIAAGAAFSSIEAFKRSQDPVITPGEVALAGITGAAGTIASGATEGMSRGVRFLAGGAAQAAPTAIYDRLTNTDRQDIALNILPQFFIGGALGAMGPREHAAKVDAASRNAMKAVELEVVKDQGLTLTKKGEAYFNPVDHLTEHEKIQISMGSLQPEIDRLMGIDRSKPLTETRLVPEPEAEAQMMARLMGDSSPKSDFEKLLAGEAVPTGHAKLVPTEVPVEHPTPTLDFGDFQRIIEQAETGSRIIESVGQDVVTEKPSTPTVSSDETKPTNAVGAASPSDPSFRFQMKRVEKINEQIGDLNLDNVGEDKARYARWSAAGMASRSEIPDITRAANMLGIDHVPKQGTGNVYFTAPDYQAMTHHENMAKLFSVNDAAYDAYVAAEKAAGREPMKPLQFFESATDAYETGLSSGNPHIDQVVENVRAIRKGDWERMQRHLVNGTHGEFDPTVIDRYTDRVQLDEAISTFGREAMIDDVIIRLRRHPGNADFANDPAKLRAVATAWLDNAATQQDRIAPWAAHTLEHDSVAIYAAKLRRAAPDLTDQQINDIIYATGPSTGDGSTPAKLRRQVRMDTAWENPSLTGPSGKAFKMNAVLIRNLEEIERMNSRYMTGRSAMAEVFRQFSTPERNVESVPQLLDVLREQAEARGINADVIKSDLHRIDYMAKLVMGVPTHPSTMFTRISRMLRNASFMRVINTATGLRNFTELASAISENGVGSMVKQLVPSLHDLFEKIKGGDIDHEATIAMHQMGIAVGEAHRLLPSPGEGEYVPQTKNFEYRIGKGLRVADRALQRGANLTSTLSLVGPSQVALERTAFRMEAQRWLDIAQGKAAMHSGARLKAMTLDPAMAQRIIQQMNLPNAVAYDQTGAGNIWAGFNFEHWTDIEAASALRQAIYKTNQRQVYKPHGSEMAPWMTSDVGKIFTQLRTFMLGSYESKTLFNLAMHDRVAIQSMATQLVAKAMAYYAITYIYSLGQPDRAKYLKDRLTDSKVAKAAFANSDFTSIIPMGVDAFTQGILGRQPVFSFARTTGLGDQPGLSGLALSNPTADTIDKTARAIGVPVNKLVDMVRYKADIARTWDPRINQRDIKSIQSGLPFQRMLGVDQFFRWLQSQAPKARPR